MLQIVCVQVRDRAAACPTTLDGSLLAKFPKFLVANTSSREIEKGKRSYVTCQNEGMEIREY